MALSEPMIKTITFPDRELLQAVQPLPEGIRGAVWDLQNEPQDIEFEDIHAVVLPYLGPKPLESLKKAPNLKMVHTQSTGYDGVPQAVGSGVAVVSAAGVHADSTAELALALILASLRGIDDSVRDQAAGYWNPQRRLSLADRKVLLLGVGGIGKEIARRLEPFDVELTRVGSSARDDDGGHVHGADELVELAGGAEVLVVITPLSEATHHLVSAEVLAAMPDGALLVNVARGAVVDSEALTAEVVGGRLRAAIDVFDPEPIPEDHPLWKAEGALIVPHNGGNTTAFYPRIVKLLRSQLSRLANGDRPENLVQPGPFAEA